MSTLQQRLGAFLTQRRFYGLMQYSVATRTQEIGIRMAVGAQASSILRMVIHEGLKLSLAGLGAGLIGVWLLGRTAYHLLFGVSASDPPTLVAVSLLLMFVDRAMRVEPIIVLRQD